MKKVSFLKVALLMLVLCTSSVTNAQDLGSFLNNVVNTAAKTVTKTTIKSSQIVGTWKYNSPACEFESDNLLANAGGAVASKKIETQLQTVCTKAGLTKAATKFTFASDGKYTCTVGKVPSSGTYTFNEKTQTLNLVTVTGLKFSAKAAMNGSNLRLLFKADKLLSLLQTLSSAAADSQVNSTLSMLTSLSKQYSGLEVGFELKK